MFLKVPRSSDDQNGNQEKCSGCHIGFPFLCGIGVDILRKEISGKKCWLHFFFPLVSPLRWLFPPTSKRNNTVMLAAVCPDFGHDAEMYVK